MFRMKNKTKLKTDFTLNNNNKKTQHVYCMTELKMQEVNL